MDRNLGKTRCLVEVNNERLREFCCTSESQQGRHRLGPNSRQRSFLHWFQNFQFSLRLDLALLKYRRPRFDLFVPCNRCSVSYEAQYLARTHRHIASLCLFDLSLCSTVQLGGSPRTLAQSYGQPVLISVIVSHNMQQKTPARARLVPGTPI